MRGRWQTTTIPPAAGDGQGPAGAPAQRVRLGDAQATFSALEVVRAYARRAKNVDRMILACFVLGLSTRKMAAALLSVPGRPVSPAIVSAVARQLDAAAAAFHRRHR